MPRVIEGTGASPVIPSSNRWHRGTRALSVLTALLALALASCDSGSPPVSGVQGAEPVVGDMRLSGQGSELAAPAWSAAAPLAVARGSHTATVLSTGRVLVVGGLGASGSLASAELHDPATGTWAATGPLSAPRAEHAAILLTSGRVLVVGGTGSGGPLASAELYDPATGTWAATGPLATPRAGATATALPSGQVLVVGGRGVSGPLASAELYDPATGTWTSTASLAQAREAFTATLLPSGRVLVAGGTASGVRLNTAEVYDVATGTWASTGRLAVGRSSHTATLLPSGQVLVAAGTSASGRLASAEVYDVATGTWTSTGALPQARHGHAAALLSSGRVFVVGGDGPSGYVAGSALYDPATGTWSSGVSLAPVRVLHTATTLPSGRVLVVGGLGSSGFLTSAQVYEPAAGSWSRTASLPFGRYGHDATLLPTGRVLVVGGVGGDYLPRAHLYDPARGTWTETGSLSRGRSFHTVTLLQSGQVLVAGGTGNGGPLSSAELYDPATGLWTVTGSMSRGREFHTATLLPSGRVLVVGGQNASGRLTSAEIYDPVTGTWTTTASLAQGRSVHTATLLPSGRVLVAGGFSGSVPVRSTEVYDPATGTWSATGSFVQGRYYHTATLLPSGRVLAVGGIDESNSDISTELYDPATGTWTAASPLSSPRFGHTATLLASGQVLVADGTTTSPVTSELYDPATGTWTDAATPGDDRYYHTATLMPSGGVLAAGGFNDGSSAEVYDVSGAPPASRPVIDSVSPGALLEPGSAFSLVGSGLAGVSGTDVPVLLLHDIENGRQYPLPTRSFSAHQVASQLPTVSYGPYLLFVTVQGVTSGVVVHLVADATAPDTVITSAPELFTTQTTATFAFTTDDAGATLECRLDDASLFLPCVSPITYANLAEGAHTFQVRARDEAGNVDLTPAIHSWRVDRTPPDTFFDATPAPLSNQPSPFFRFSSNEPGAALECSLDNAPFTSCASPHTLVLLTEGAHTFQVRARDEAGNVDASPAAFAWLVDLTAPETAITAAPASPAGPLPATFEFSASEAAATFECSLDTQTFAPCASPMVYSGLGEGSHTFRVRAMDVAGNRDAMPATHTWLVDLTGPETDITAAPPTLTRETTTTFTFGSAEADARFECRLDGAAFAACTSPTTYTQLGEGTHVFRVRALDALGNVESAPALHSWRVDLTAPRTELTSVPGSPTNRATSLFAFSSSDASASFECSVDGAAFSACASPMNVGPLAEGTHVFQVRARDAAGNVEDPPVFHSWQVDLTAPETEITSAPADPDNRAVASFTFRTLGVEAHVFECRLDGAAFSACTSAVTYSGLGEGPHTFEVRARDAAGNVDATPAAHAWWVDLTAPETELGAGPARVSRHPVATFMFYANGSSASFECSLDEAAFSACTSPLVLEGLAEGTHTFQVRARDAAGNVDASPVSYSWDVDLTAPVVQFVTTPPPLSNQATAMFRLDVTETGVSFLCSLDDAPFLDCDFTVVLEGLAEGPHSFVVSVRDAAGNTSNELAAYTWRIDLTPPETVITSAPPLSGNQASAAFTVSASEAGGGFECSVDDGEFSACTSTVVLEDLAEGLHVFRVRARDAAGNVDDTPASHTWSIDLSVPAAPVITAPANGATVENSRPTFTGTAQPGSTVTLTLDGAAVGDLVATEMGAWSFTPDAPLADGAHAVSATARDTGGTSVASPVVRFTIDTTPEVVPPPASEGGGGCAAGPGDASVLLGGLALLAGLVSRRRRFVG
jgi:hypothetical protein